ncbi:MAG: hypothetical protein U9Q07_04350 [Planctomycetota bacterium]|nr:hypothetical protein [Planctomycetota bacterium]
MEIAINVTEEVLNRCAFQTPFDPDVFETVSCPICGLLVPAEDADEECPNGCEAE